MAVPFVSARIKQANQPGARGGPINARQIRALAAVAMDAAVSAIAERIRSTVLDGDDVLVLECARENMFGEMAVFASKTGPSPNGIQ
jgi:hypothetical protein